MKIANFHTPRVFNAPADGVPLGILYRRMGLRKLQFYWLLAIANQYQHTDVSLMLAVKLL